MQPSASAPDAQHSQRSQAQRTERRSASSEDLPWQTAAVTLAARASNGPMRVRLICARREHAKRAGGCAPCGKRNEPPRSSARRASQGDACARHLAAGSGDRIGWKLVERPICHHGRVAGGALYRNAAGSERSRGELRPPELVSQLGDHHWRTRRAARYDGGRRRQSARGGVRDHFEHTGSRYCRAVVVRA